MKKIAFYSPDDCFNHNNVAFDKSAEGIGYSLYMLKEDLKNLNINLLSPDSISEDKFDAFLYLDINIKNLERIKIQKKNNKKLFLLLSESHIINKNNWKREYHKLFDIVFSWDPRIIDSEKYFHYFWPIREQPNYSNQINFNKDFTSRNKICLMSGNKNNSNFKELYSLRLKVINWYNSKAKALDLDLYGPGWENGYLKIFFISIIKINFFRRLINLITRKKILSNLFMKKYRNYKGIVDNKRITLSNYKFSICFENAKDIPGYVTEKIFDCFFSGTIPIYLGVKNAEEIFPNLFIDMRKFKSINELDQYLNSLTIEQYVEFRMRIHEYTTSLKFSNSYSATNYSKNISNIINKYINN